MSGHQKNSGFTIVELLIVIVVVAILAAITIVAYSGIQNQAKDAIVKNDMNTVSKALEFFYVDNGRYPSSTSDYAAVKATGLTIRRHDTATNSMLYCIDTANPNAWMLLAYGYPLQNPSNHKWSSDGLRTTGVGIGSGTTTCRAQFVDNDNVNGVWINSLANYSN